MEGVLVAVLPISSAAVKFLLEFDEAATVLSCHS
jgi:hypothetical protein